MMRNQNQKGITLVEVMTVLVILGVAYVGGKIGADMIGSFHKQGSMIHARKEAQQILYQISRDIRNAEAILEVSESRMVLRLVNPGILGFDTNVNTTLFDPSNMRVITYEYTPKSDTRPDFLARRIEVGGTLMREEKLLQGALLEPDVTNFIFRGQDIQNTNVEVAFRLAPSFYKKDATAGTKDSQIVRAIVRRRSLVQ